MNNKKTIKNMKIINSIIISIVITGIIFGCQSKTAEKAESVISFEKFITQLEKDYQKYTSENWKEADTTYNIFCRKFDNEYESVLNEADKEKISNLKGKYKGYKLKYNAKNALNNVKDVLNDVGNQVGGFIDALKKDS